MKHLIIGTAGHIDHGKTALVRALSGIECDTHKEEKTRGITIHLGFAHLKLSDEQTVGIVDVPGHAAFVRTMVAGASGIDFCLLVVAADSGVMPQTREHLQIMSVLGIRSGLVALTKTDVVSPDIVEMAREEISELVKGTFLEGCPIVPVSSKTGEGLEELRTAIAGASAQAALRAPGEVFRLFVDRVFTVKGFGTVVTGSVISGTLREGDSAHVLPRNERVRVRRMERHGEQTAVVETGDRASLNLVGLDRAALARGMMVSDRSLKGTTLVDAKLSLFDHVRGFGIWSQVIFYLGTSELQARVHLIDRNSLAGGETALVQIELTEACMAQSGDRFVLRSTSSDITLGGGEIIDAFPLHHRRRPPALVENLRALADGKGVALIAAEVRKRMMPLEVGEVADILNLARDDVLGVLRGEIPPDITMLEHEQRCYLFKTDTVHSWRAAMVQGIEQWHSRNPLEPTGRPLANVVASLGLAADESSMVVIELLLDTLVDEGVLKKIGRTWASAGHQVFISPRMRAHIDFVARYLADCGMKTPLMSELGPLAAQQGIDEKELRKLLRYLTNTGDVYRIGDEYLHASVVDRCRTRLVAHLEKAPEGVTVADFRDLVGGNRKICLLMLSQFDVEGTTARVGDRRVLARAR